MKVTTERFEDAGEKDEDGYYDYYYSGTIFRFEEGDEALVARQYEDEAHRASFLRRERIQRRKPKSKMFTRIPYDDPVFQSAVRYLLEEVRVTEVSVLVAETGYTLVDQSKIGSI